MTCISPKCGLKASSPIKGLCWIHWQSVTFHRAPRDGRRCQHPGCISILSKYNRAKYCGAHEREHIDQKVSLSPTDSGIRYPCEQCGNRTRSLTKVCRACARELVGV